MRKIIILLSNAICLLLSSLSFSQTSFSYLVSTPYYECIFDEAEDEFGNYYMVGRKYYDSPMSDPAYLLVLNNEGQLLYEHEFYSQDTSSYFGSVYYKNDSIIIFGALGVASNELKDKLWVLFMDVDYNILQSKFYYMDGYGIGDIESIINHNGNYVICGNVYKTLPDTDLFFFEISPSGDSLNLTILQLEGIEMEFDLIEKSNGGYKVFTNGNFPGAPNTQGSIVEIDSSFNYISGDSIPYQLYFCHSARWLSIANYLVTGYKSIINPTRRDMGIIKSKANNEFILGNHFGKTGDTISYVGACSNLDFIDPESIYFGGASNIHPQMSVFQPDSWLLLNSLDSNLNLKWQRFYGGDAGYYLWGLKATRDGGCLMMATRWDAAVQDYELDVYILKVDSNGLLTSTGDYPTIPVQQLAIFPNPSRDIISIRYPDIFGNLRKDLIIFNSLGNDVKHISATQNPTETRADISDLPVGMYFTVLQVEGEKIATGKFLVVR